MERLVHKTIDRLTDLRIRQNREFFNIDPQTAFDILVDISTTLTDAVIMLKGEPYDPAKRGDKQPKPEKKIAPRASFRFSMIGLATGDVITFEPTGQEVVVATDNKVEYEGRLYSLSAFTGTFMPEEKQNASGAYQGPKYFAHNGETLWNLRLKMEEENNQE